MEHNKEPKVRIHLSPVHLPDGQEWQGKAEGGDEEDDLLLQRALAKLGRTEDTMDGHKEEMNDKKEPEN